MLESSNRTRHLLKHQEDAHVNRGGSWLIVAQAVRAAFRFWRVPGGRVGGLGFRCSSSGPYK
jgi:formylglycine-generating enzyme required for sulfatase activity